MSDDLFCPHCGARNPAGSNFCNRCGAALAGELERPAIDPAAPLYGTDIAGEALEGNIPAAGPVEEVTPEQGVVAAVDEGSLEELLGASLEGPPAAPSGAPGAAGAADTVPGEAEPVAPLDGGALVVFPDEQLLGSGQGYLESVAISGEMATPAAMRPAAPVDTEHWRTLRALMREEPALATSLSPVQEPQYNYRRLWIVLLLLIAALIPFSIDGKPSGMPPVAPGVVSAFDQIGRLEVDDEVLVYWQYDPATAGEMDVVAEPVISHLLDRSARSIVLTLLPGGLASARRLYAQAVAGLDESALITVLQGWVGDGVYLPGGASALPLVARDPSSALSFAPPEPADPQLALLVASSADDVQQWLEIVQPRDGLVAVAVTTAAAEPVLRPYLESRQLAGLVSGFDGAAGYQSLRGPALSAASQRRQALVVNAQNWGALALLLIVAIGNLVRLFWRERRG